MPPKIPQTQPPAPPVEAEIEKLVYGGEGLARVDGQVLLTPFVLPGEQIRTPVRRVKPGLLRGLRPEILKSSPERIAPGCPYFGDCGGCHYQQAGYPFQLAAKKAILLETLQRMAGLQYEGEVKTVSAEPWGYRNRVQLHFADRQSGFHKAGSHELCPIDHCPISSPVLVEAIGKIAEAVKAPQWPRFLRSLELFTNETDLQIIVGDTEKPIAARFFEWCGTFLPNLAPSAIEYAAAGFTFQISRGSFFQVNRFLVDALVAEALGGLSGKHGLDLYAGVGLFTLPLKNRFERVTAVERSVPAHRDLEFNVARAGLSIETERSSAEDYLIALDEAPDLVIADPPRAGLGNDATEDLLRLRPEQLLLVSCDPATLSRDLKKLLVQYEVRRLALVDLFPQTYHFETIVHLQRK